MACPLPLALLRGTSLGVFLAVATERLAQHRDQLGPARLRILACSEVRHLARGACLRSRQRPVRSCSAAAVSTTRDQLAHVAAGRVTLITPMQPARPRP